MWKAKSLVRRVALFWTFCNSQQYTVKQKVGRLSYLLLYSFWKIQQHITESKWKFKKEMTYKY